MLEERIGTLIQSIDCLTAVINRLWDEKDNIRGVKAPPISADPPETKTKTEKPKTKKASPPKEEPKTTDIPSVKDLEAICLKIIRDNGPTLKKKIKNTIKAHGGEMVADCPVDKLVHLKLALEALL